MKAKYVILFAASLVTEAAIVPDYCEQVFHDPADCCSPLFGVSDRPCAGFESVRDCCIPEIRSKAWSEIMTKISRILHRRDLPTVIQYFVPSGFFLEPSLLYQFPDERSEDAMSRLVVYSLALEWSLDQGDGVSEDAWYLLDEKLFFEFPWSQVPPELPLFGVLHRLWLKTRDMYVTEACLSSWKFQETSEANEIQRQLASAPCVMPVFLALPSPLFEFLDSRNLPTLIEHRFSCGERSCDFARPQEVALPSGEAGSFVIRIPKTREMPAEANRLSGPFILPQTLLELAVWLGEEKISDPLTVVEVGAHYGDCSLFLQAALNGTASFFVFEPQTEAYAMLRDSVRLNGWEEKMKIFNFGLVGESTAAKSNVFALNLVRGSSVHGAMIDRDPFGTPAHELYVDKTAASTLDRILAESVKFIDLLLVQTNGAEIEVLLGAREIFTSRRVRKLVLRTWLFAPYVDDEGREYRREDKWNVLAKILDEYGCRDVVRTRLHESENSLTAYCD